VAQAARVPTGSRNRPPSRPPARRPLRPILRAPYARACISLSQPNAAIANWHILPIRTNRGDIPMLDLVYILIGAVFLGACVLYAYACDRL
jgi:hypothetical protein